MVVEAGSVQSEVEFYMPGRTLDVNAGPVVKSNEVIELLELEKSH